MVSEPPVAAPVPPADRFGNHSIHVEGDMLVVTLRGDLTLGDAEMYIARVAAHSERFGYLLMLTDVSQATRMSSQVRAYFVRTVREFLARRGALLPAARASFGASLLARAVSTMAYAAMQLVLGREQTYKVTENEAEARLWLAEQRAIIRARLGLSSQR
jgi:hypothetical protein